MHNASDSFLAIQHTCISYLNPQYKRYVLIVTSFFLLNKNSKADKIANILNEGQHNVLHKFTVDLIVFRYLQLLFDVYLGKDTSNLLRTKQLFKLINLTF